MATSKASSVAPIAAVQSAGEQTLEQPRAFHFAVTWVTLFTHLDLIESKGPRTARTEVVATRALAPVVVAPPAVLPPAPAMGEAAWEMVVPKMNRSGSGEFTPAEEKGLRR
jgi:hypothetical protein